MLADKTLAIGSRCGICTRRRGEIAKEPSHQRLPKNPATTVEIGPFSRPAIKLAAMWIVGLVEDGPAPYTPALRGSSCLVGRADKRVRWLPGNVAILSMFRKSSIVALTKRMSIVVTTIDAQQVNFRLHSPQTTKPSRMPGNVTKSSLEEN